MKNSLFSLLFKANLFITILLFLPFLLFNSDYSFLSYSLSFMATISSAGILVLVLYLALFILSFWRIKGLYIVSGVFILVHIGLIIDFFIYRLFHFHINAMVLNILTSPSAKDSVQLGFTPYIAFGIIVITLITIEWYLIYKLKQKDETSLTMLNSKLNKFIILPLFLIILIEKFSYGTAYLFANSDITSKFKVIPLYQPLTFTKFATKHLGFEPQNEAQTIVSNNKALNYPLQPLQLKDNPDRVNIFIFASDSVRYQTLSEEIAPNIMNFAKDSLIFTDHYSGGNSTRFGIFSLMYGLNSTYWFNFLNANRGAVLFEVLEDLGYQINVTSSTDTNWPEFRKTCYVDQQECIKDDFIGTPAEKDLKSSNYFKEWIDNSEISKPYFSFVFLDAPHQRSYPREYAKFLPDNGGETNYLTVDSSDREELFNQYKNSIYYNDALFAQMIDKLKERGLYENSIIIYTADHGQEFFEHGNFGHNSSFSRYQTNVPMIIKIPNRSPKSISKISSHVDIVPTLLSYIGVLNNSSDYSNGYDLLSQEYDRKYIFTANWNNNAIVTDKSTMIFSNLPNKMFNNEILSSKTYKKVSKSESDIDSAMILEILNQNKRFLK